MSRETRKNGETLGAEDNEPDGQEMAELEPIFPMPMGILETAEEKERYQRLKSDPRSLDVVERMERWGIAPEAIDLLFRQIAGLHAEWGAWFEKPGDCLKRRSAVANRLRALAEEFDRDPRLRPITYQIANYPFDEKIERFSASEVLRELATEAEPPDMSYLRRRRKIPFQTFAARVLCDEIVHLRGWAPWNALPWEDPTITDKYEPAIYRAPNLETATLLSVAYKLRVTPDTVTQARKKVRRRYFREN